MKANHPMNHQTDKSTSQGSVIKTSLMLWKATVNFVCNDNIIKTFPESPNKGSEEKAQDICWEGTCENFFSNGDGLKGEIGMNLPSTDEKKK